MNECADNANSHLMLSSQISNTLASWRFKKTKYYKEKKLQPVHLKLYKPKLYKSSAIAEMGHRFATIDDRSASPAKFGRNQWNCGRDMAIFRFLKMAAAAILDFSNFKFLMVGQPTRIEMRRRAKFGQNRSKRGRDMAIFRFFKMAPPPSCIFQISNF